MDVYLVRHGESAVAASGTFGDDGLSAVGREQARALGRALAPIAFETCYCSPLKRARETAEVALDGRPVPLVIDAALAEADVGDLAGLSFEEARQRYPDDLRLGVSTVARIAANGRTAPGGESRAAFLERVEASRVLVQRELERPDGPPSLFVSHGGLLNYLLQRLLSMPVRDDVPFGFDNCGGARLVWFHEPPAFGPFPMLRSLALAR